jgi:hypothetical protein
MDCSHCGKFKSHHRCQTIVGQGEGCLAHDNITRICGIIICAICSTSFENEDGIFRCSRHSVAVSSAVGASSSSKTADCIPSCKIPKDASRAGGDKQQQIELNEMIGSADWKNPSNFIVEDNVLKQILGMDATLYNVDMLRKICGKLGFISRMFNKAVCQETIIKVVLDGKVDDAIDPASSSTAADSTSLRCRLLNVIMSEAFVSRLQFLGARKEMAELDLGGAEQNKAFWEDVSVKFNDYSKPDNSKLILSSLSEQKSFSEKQVDPSAKSTKNSLGNLYVLVAYEGPKPTGFYHGRASIRRNF